MLGYKVASIRSGVHQSTRTQTIERCDDPTSNIDLVVASLKVSAVGVNIQRGCSSMLIVEHRGCAPDLLQAIGRLHRLGQPRPQEIIILTLDASFDMYLQYKMANRFIPSVVASSNIQVPTGHPNPDGYLVSVAETVIANLFGQRESRLKTGNVRVPFSYLKYPPGARLPRDVQDSLTGK